MTNNLKPALSPDLKARVLAAAKKTPSPTRDRARIRQLAMLIFAFAIASVPTLVYCKILYPEFISLNLTAKDVLQGNTRELPLPLLAWTTAGSFLVAMTVVWAALSRGRSMLGRNSTVLAIVIVATPVVLFCWRYGWALDYDWAFPWYGRSSWGKKCLEVSLATALAPLAAFLTLRRGSDPNHPAATGAAMGVSAGACSWALVDLTCPVGAPLHLLVGHVLPILILGVIGAILGKWLLAVREGH